MTPLMAVVRVDDDNTVRLATALITHGADVNAIDNDGDTAVDYAAIAGNVQALRLLLANGAAVEHRAKDGKTPLLVSANSFDVDVYQQRDNHHCTPACAHLLILHGAHVNATGPGGMTALMYLSGDYNEDDAIRMAKDLIAHGASVNMKDVYGHTAAQIAAKHKRKKLAGFLRHAER